MTRQAFAEPGQSMQQIGGTCPAGWVVMQEDRPTPEHVANEAGEWVLPPAPVPQAVTPAQGLMALYVLHSITEADIHATINGIEDPVMRYQAMIAFTRATVWDRASEALGMIAQMKGLTESDLDAAFTLGATFTNL